MVCLEVHMKSKTKEILTNISIGDFLHYCPEDLETARHDIGVIYNIDHQKNIYYVY